MTVKRARNIVLAMLMAPIVMSYARAQPPAPTPDLRLMSSNALYKLGANGDLNQTEQAIAELRTRAATGDPAPTTDLDNLLATRATAGFDSAVAELLGRARAGDGIAQSILTATLGTAAENGSQAAMAELRRRANETRVPKSNTDTSESSLDQALAQRAAAGDEAALAELHVRANTLSAIGRIPTALADALGHLAGLGDPVARDVLLHAANAGDGYAQYTLGPIYRNGTPDVKPDLSMAARVRGCPVPDETIMAGCQTVPVDLVPKAVFDVTAKLKCDDDDPSPVLINLHGPGNPAYKISCFVPQHGASAAVVIANIRGRWKRIADLDGYSDLCPGFFPLKTVHAGFHDMCLDVDCAAIETKDGTTACKATILEFDGRRYQQQ
jgi:hypothetical protein